MRSDLLRQVGFQPAGSITRDFITYELAAGASVPQELRARIEAIATAANVAVFFLKQGEDSW